MIELERIAKLSQSLAQKIVYFINTQEFQDFYCNLTSVEKEFLKECVRRQDLNCLRAAFYDYTKNIISLKSVRALRLMAADLGIIGFTRLSKEDLIIELTQVLHAVRTSKTTV